jgi:uncharacterized protein DUF6262
MHPDNTAPLITAARKRSELTRSKAIQAIRELDRAGTSVTFEAVARAADVSRSWLYAQADLRAEIEHLREATQRAPAPPIPSGQRATDASLLRRLAEANERNRRLSDETPGSADNSNVLSATSAPTPLRATRLIAVR